MLHQVPEKLRQSSRILVMRHPNSVDISVCRKVNVRTDEDGDDSVNTRGGVRVMSSEDNADYTIEIIGDGKMLFLERVPGAEFNSEGDNLIYTDGQLSAYIEPLHEGEWEARKHDRVFVIYPGYTMEYQIANFQSAINMPPYAKTYYLQPLEHSPDMEEMP